MYMRNIKKSVKAFSMVEVIVASIILMTTITLVFGTIANTRKPVVVSTRKLRAATYAQEVLDTLRTRVNDSEWNNATVLKEGDHYLNEILAAPTGVSGTYKIKDENGFKKVTANVTYNDDI
ncbi:MAG: hypothetical protein HQL21_01335 [Candidatus Omnitrophica bacterium]|nr:hypothetical protein [Candidatus Omnitrophota bacterium]